MHPPSRSPDFVAASSSIVSQRLREVVSAHEACLSSSTSVTVRRVRRRRRGSPRGGGRRDGTDDVVGRVASRRSDCAPPDGGPTISSSEPSRDRTVSALRSDPRERARSVLPGARDDEHLRAVAALAALCEEAAELDDVATDHVLPALTLFGADDDAATAVVVTDAERETRRRSRVKRTGECLFFLQGAFNMTLRCRRLARNMICQLAGAAEFWCDDDGRRVESVHLFPVAEALGTVFRILISVDLVIANNKELLEAWEMYKEYAMDAKHKLFPAAADGGDQQEGASSSPSSGDEKISLEKMEAFSRMIVQLDFSLMSSRSFLSAIEQNLDPGGLETNPLSSFRTNDRLHAEVKLHIVTLYERYISRLDTDGEIHGLRRHMVGVYGLYALHRRLVPSNSAPDMRLHQSLMTTFPRRCPVVHLTGNVAFVPADFLAQYTPYDELVPTSSSSAIKGWLVSSSSPTATAGGGGGSDGPDGHHHHAASSSFVARFDANFPTVATATVRRVLAWTSTADSTLAATVPFPTTSNGREIDPATPRERVEDETALVLRGLVLASRCGQLARDLLTLHRVFRTPLPSTSVRPLRRLLEALKAVERTFDGRRRRAVLTIHQAALRSTAASVYETFDGMRSVVDRQSSSSTTASAAKMERLNACMTVLEGALKGTSTYNASRRFTAAVAACVCSQEFDLASSADDDHHHHGPSTSTTSANTATPKFTTSTRSGNAIVTSLFRRLEVLSSLDDYVRRSCDCSFLYFHRELLSPLLEDALSHHEIDVGTTRGVQLLLTAFSDPERRLLRCAPRERRRRRRRASGVDDDDDDNSYVRSYRAFLAEELLRKSIVDPLCREVETDLRLTVHEQDNAARSELTRHLRRRAAAEDDVSSTNETTESRRPRVAPPPASAWLSALNPKRNRMTKKSRHLLDMPTLRVCGEVFSVKDKVRRYLEKSFYSLTSISLHDCHTYTEMRFLAREKYGLELQDNQLPMGSLEQSLDVLDIMMNIQTFVKKYNYNLNQQNFVERKPNQGAKCLNSICIQSISASVRQHGLGILSTAVNSTYKFLSMKFEEFSQFAANDYLSSYFSKERRWLENKQIEVYPFDRAVRFMKDVRKLGVSSGDGHTFLDRFRTLLSQIGNALGFVRMVRAARMNFCCDATQFVPDVSNSIGARVKSQSVFSGDSLRAAENVDRVVDALSKDESNYFQVLVNVFRDVLGSSKHDHLDNFFLIVPALSLSWMEASIRAKEMTYKKNRTRDAYYTDDGFAMGTAFVLGILEQNDQFDNLLWFESLQKKFDADAKTIIEKKNAHEENSVNSSEGVANEQSLSCMNESADDLTTLRVTGKRLEAHRREMEMWFFSMHGTRLFFRGL